MQPEKMRALIDVIDECINQVSRARLWETAELLRMAKLDLVARANGISEEELEIFSFALERSRAEARPDA